MRPNAYAPRYALAARGLNATGGAHPKVRTAREQVTEELLTQALRQRQPLRA